MLLPRKALKADILACKDALKHTFSKLFVPDAGSVNPS